MADGTVNRTSDSLDRAFAPSSQSPLRRRGARFLEHKLAVASGLMLLVLAALALAAPLIAHWLGTDGVTADLFNRLVPASAEHPLGTDEAGRDVLVRLLYGGRISLAVALVTAIITACIGAGIGLVAGYYGGPLDSLLMRLTDGVIALPLLPLLIVLAAVDLTKLGLSAEAASGEDTNLYRIVIIIALVGWTTVARLVRAEALTLRRRDFVRAAVAQGAGPTRILFTHILPNCASPLVVATTLSVGNIILFESVLSFLGLGIQPPVPSWGNMLTNAQDIIWDSPMLAVWPGGMIFLTVIAFNFVGDGLQDALDPKAFSDR